MSYRLPEKRSGFRPCHTSHLDDTASRTILTVDNGTISHIAIPCFYGEDHDRMAHDHAGWPSPRHPDRSCQLPPGCERMAIPIDMEGEGYKTVEVSMIDPPDGLVISGEVKYGIVDLTVQVMCDSAVNDDIDVVTCIYVTGDFGSYTPEHAAIAARDVVFKGIVHIVSGPIR